jgi:hypothetical protein
MDDLNLNMNMERTHEGVVAHAAAKRCGQKAVWLYLYLKIHRLPESRSHRNWTSSPPGPVLGPGAGRDREREREALRTAPELGWTPTRAGEKGEDGTTACMSEGELR